MKPAPFEYVAPESLPVALEALKHHGSDAKILAGGQSLMPLLNLRLLKPSVIIDLNQIDELSYIVELPAGLSIGAMTRQSKIEDSELIRRRCPLISEATKHIGHVAIRHRGTVGGSLVHADPSAELPAVALALDANFQVVGTRGIRTIPAQQFFLDYLTTAIGPDEILKEITFPAMQPNAGYAVLEVARRHGDFALAGVVTVLNLDAGGKIADVRIALFGVALTAVRALKTEEALKDHKPDLNIFREAVALLDEAMEPLSDIHASAEYRRQVAASLTVRALEKALSRSGRGV